MRYHDNHAGARTPACAIAARRWAWRVTLKSSGIIEKRTVILALINECPTFSIHARPRILVHPRHEVRLGE